MARLKALHVHWRRRRARRRCPDNALRAFLCAPLTDLATDYREHELLALDLETTGLTRDAHVVSVGWVPVVNGRVVLSGARRILVRSPQPMNDSALIHGLRDSDIDSGMDIHDALLAILTALTGRTLIVHHAGLDVAVLDSLCRRRLGAGFVAPVVDTLRLGQRHLARTEALHGQLRLAALRERYGLPRAAQHDALYDAVATAELFLALAAHAAGRKPLPLQRLIS